MDEYMVHVIPDGKFWFITVDGVPGATQARSADEIQTMALDFISMNNRIPKSTIRLTVTRERTPQPLP